MHTTSFLPNSLLTCSSSFLTLPKSLRIAFIPIRSFSDQDKDQDKNYQSFPLRLLQLSTTLTIVSTSLSLSSAVPAALSAPNVPEKKRTPSSKSVETLSPQELKSWCGDLPTVNERIPYTDVMHLKEDGKLKYIVKLQSSDLKLRPDPILVVLNDSRVFRTTFPSVNRDKRFWSEWERLELNSICINAYTPPIKSPQLPMPLLGFLIKWMPLWMTSLVNNIPKLFLKRSMVEKSLKRSTIDEKKEADRAMQAEKKLKDKLKRMEMRKLRKLEYQQSIEETKMKYQKMDLFWKRIANDTFIINTIGIVFFYLFYRVVVLNYRKQKKDYEDRLKIEESEREEKRKIKILEREMAGLEPGDGKDEFEEGEGETEENPYMKMAANFMQSGARVRRVHGKKHAQFMDSGNEVKFTDVAGLGKIRVELEEVVKFFTHGDMYRRRGVKIPGGILLCGPPGVGKTLLAKAVAGEAGVNFFSISASQFVEIYVGVGASRVRALYQEAKENAPSVVFIDELDAVGRERGLIKGSGGQERDATLNQLLVCLDGFEGRGDVITIAATNRPDILDPALVRPGRFDRKIYIPKPGVIGRDEILQVHARKKSMARDVDFMAVASMTDGMVGAELANIIEVAAINMMRDGRSEVNTDDLLQAAQFEERGHLDKRERSLDMWKQLALNEAAIAVMAANFPDMNDIEFITISPRAGRELGYVRVKMDGMKFDEGMLSRQSLLDHITVQLAPRAADEIWYGKDKLSTVWAETTDNARSAARSFVLGGFSENYHGLTKFWVTDRLNNIDLEALRILNICYNRSKEILNRNRILVDVLVDKLVNKKSLAKQEFLQLVEEFGHLEPLPPSIVDIRMNRQAELQEIKANATRKSIHGTTLQSN